MALQAGRLRHKVELQSLLSVQDPVSGLVTESWQTYARVWAAMEPASAREFMAAAAEQSKVSGKAIIRHRTDVNASHAILYRGKRYEILGVLEDPVSMLEYITLPFGEGVRVDPEPEPLDSNGDPI